MCLIYPDVLSSNEGIHTAKYQSCKGIIELTYALKFYELGMPGALIYVYWF